MTDSIQPLVSVVIPAYNSEDTIGRAVESVLKQDYSSLEVIVVDDGSKDETAAAVEALNDNRVRVIRQANAGPAAARNRGIRESRGEFVAFNDDDDEWLPGRLTRCIAPMLADPAVALVFCWAVDCFPDGREEIRGDDYEKRRVFPLLLWPSSRQTTPGTTIRHAAVEKVGLLDESLHTREDLDLWVRIREQFKITEIPEVLVRVYPSPSGVSQSSALDRIETDYFRVIERAFARDPARYEPLRATIMAEAWHVWGVTYLGRNQIVRARTYLWRSMRQRFKCRTLYFWLRTFIPLTITNWLRRRRHPQ